MVVLAAALLVLTGCGSDPKPSPHNAAPPASNSPAPSTKDDTSLPATSSDSTVTDLLPPRPRELDLSDVDPCTDLLTEQHLRDLNYDLGYNRPPTPGRDDIHGGPSCVFASLGAAGGVDRNVGTLITISTTEGALAWVTDPARKRPRLPDVTTIEGFSALVLPNPVLSNNCLVVVDTAEGQYLDVSTGASTGKGPGPEPYCEEAKRVAGLAIQTISR